LAKTRQKNDTVKIVQRVSTNTSKCSENS